MAMMVWARFRLHLVQKASIPPPVRIEVGSVVTLVRVARRPQRHSRAPMSPPPESPAPPSLLTSAVERLGTGLVALVEELGGLAGLLYEVVKWSVRPPYRVVNLFAQLDFVGVGSVFIVALTGVFSGMVFAHQSWRAFELFNAESLVGLTVPLTITRELAPVFTALMVTMAGGQRDVHRAALHAGDRAGRRAGDDGGEPGAVPAGAAGAGGVADGAPAGADLRPDGGLAGGYFVAVTVKGLSAGTFISRTQQWLDPEDIGEGVVKGAVFGLFYRPGGLPQGLPRVRGRQGRRPGDHRGDGRLGAGYLHSDYFVGVLMH